MTRRASHITFLFLVGMLSLLSLPARVAAQRGMMGSDTGEAGTGGNYVIQGTLFLPSGQRTDRPMRVRLVTPTRGTITTMTDDNGVFSFRRLAPGSYSVVIDGEKDFEAVNEAVNIIQAMRSVSSTESVILVQIRLKAKPGITSKPEVINADLENVPKSALQFYNQALELGRSSSAKEAIEKLKQAIAYYPKFMLAFNEMGVQYSRLGELDKANDALRNALKISPNAPMPLLNRGVVLMLLGKLDEAAADLRHILQQDDESGAAHFYLGQVLANQRHFDEAELHLTKSIALGGDQWKDAHRFLGGIYLERGDRTRGVTELETYLKLSPNARDADQVRQIIRQNQKSRND